MSTRLLANHWKRILAVGMKPQPMYLYIADGTGIQPTGYVLGMATSRARSNHRVDEPHFLVKCTLVERVPKDQT